MRSIDDFAKLRHSAHIGVYNENSGPPHDTFNINFFLETMFSGEFLIISNFAFYLLYG